VEDRAQVIAEIRAVTRRPDLLAEEAGVLLGLAPSRPLPEETARYELMAALLTAAGADEAAVARWAEIGEERAKGVQASRAVPHTSHE
jgi:hypothetical protein